MSVIASGSLDAQKFPALQAPDFFDTGACRAGVAADRLVHGHLAAPIDPDFYGTM